MYGGFCYAAADLQCYIDELVYDFIAQIDESELYFSSFRLGQLLGATAPDEETLYSENCETEFFPQAISNTGDLDMMTGDQAYSFVTEGMSQ
jgi:hypothetical protein